ncbi:type II secretion system F family protein [Roseiflexus sp.]|uniref:type II secretion system F family protein n=1 Tax=Roseiflexus sp. TaxID=2562120 RepID=UPI00398AF9F1
MDPNAIIAPGTTHPETVWLAEATPLAATIAAILVVTLLMRSRLGAALDTYLAQRFTRPGADLLDPALRWHPPVISASYLLAICVIAALVILIVMSRVGPLLVAIVLAGPATALLIWVLLWVEEQRYAVRLDEALPASVGRLEAQLRSGSGLQPAIEKVIADMPASPLKTEWSWLLERLGQPIAGGSLATATTVCAALRAQTPSRRHATFLGHLEIAIDQPHTSLVQRVRAAYESMQASDRRASLLATELAQMRNTGIALFLINVGITLYLFIVQHERFVTAYRNDAGVLVGTVLALVVGAPLIGGYLLGRTEDITY